MMIIDSLQAPVQGSISHVITVILTCAVWWLWGGTTCGPQQMEATLILLVHGVCLVWSVHFLIEVNTHVFELGHHLDAWTLDVHWCVRCGGLAEVYHHLLCFSGVREEVFLAPFHKISDGSPVFQFITGGGLKASETSNVNQRHYQINSLWPVSGRCFKKYHTQAQTPLLPMLIHYHSRRTSVLRNSLASQILKMILLVLFVSKKLTDIHLQEMYKFAWSHAALKQQTRELSCGEIKTKKKFHHCVYK